MRMWLLVGCIIHGDGMFVSSTVMYGKTLSRDDSMGLLSWGSDEGLLLDMIDGEGSDEDESEVKAVSRLSHNTIVIQGLFSEVCMGDEGRSHSGRASFQNPGRMVSRCQTSQAWEALSRRVFCDAMLERRWDW